MNIADHYRELGLAPGSSDAEVKEAWRRLAARWHPDRNKSPHALRKIQRINQAVDEIRRWRASGFAELQEARGEPDLPEEVVEHAVTISLEEACAGCSRELHGEVHEQCAGCHGTGHEPQASACAPCHGSGRTRPHLWFSWLSATVTCEACEGAGRVRKRCASCEGSGQARPRKYRCRIDVPAGTHSGTVLHVHARVQGRHRVHALDLRVDVDVARHPVFRVDADGTVHCDVPVDGFAWMAERWTEVPTPRGPQQIRLRRNFLTYRMKGHGLGGAECLVTIVPLFPEELGAEQQLLIDRLVAGNTGARTTKAGKRMAEWQAQLARKPGR